MKLKKLFPALIAALFALSPLSACVRERYAFGDYIVPEYQDNVRIHIGAWGGGITYLKDGSGKPNPQWFKDLTDAGFNLIHPMWWDSVDFGGRSSLSLQRSLDVMNIAAEYGVDVLVNDTNLARTHINDPVGKIGWDPSNVGWYKDHKAFFGLAIIDEPTYQEFEIYIKEKHEKFLETFGADTDKWFFVNLRSSGGGLAYMGTPTFKGYCDGYLSITGANVLSTDNYVLQADNTVRTNFFSDIEVSRKAAKKYGVPLNNFILSIPHKFGLGDYKDPTENELLWQTTVNLAYGLESFMYYTYAPPDDPGAKYGNGLVTISGEKLAKWHYAKTINSRLLQWDHVYMNFARGWERTFGIPAAHGGIHSLFSQLQNIYDPALDTIDGIKSISCDNEVLLGEFYDKDGNQGFMLTNATIPFQGKTASVTIKFDNAGRNGYQGVQLYENGLPRIVDLNAGGELVVTLDPGDGKFMIPLRKAVL